jgi:AcrR family transcriptional regulator
VSLLELALAAQTAPDDPTSERILDAALDVAAGDGIRGLTMDAVAARAAVGRMTVYRRFGEKGRLVQALAAREARRCLADLDAASDPGDPIADQVAEAFVASLRLAREHPLLRRLTRDEPGALLAELRAGLFDVARAATAARLRAAQRAGELGDVDADHAAELLVRLALSFALLPDTGLPLGDDRRLRALARDMVAPVVGG